MGIVSMIDVEVNEMQWLASPLSYLLFFVNLNHVIQTLLATKKKEKNGEISLSFMLMLIVNCQCTSIRSKCTNCAFRGEEGN